MSVGCNRVAPSDVDCSRRPRTWSPCPLRGLCHPAPALGRLVPRQASREREARRCGYQRICELLVAAPAVAGAGGGRAAADLKLATWNLEWLTLLPAGDAALPPDVQPKQPADRALLRALCGPAGRRRGGVPGGGRRGSGGDRVPAGTVCPAPDRAIGWCSGSASRCAAASPSPPIRTSPRSTRQARGCARAPTSRCTGRAGSLRLLAVHLKQGCRRGQADRPARAESCPVLPGSWRRCSTGWRARVAGGEPFVLAGDFNRWMDGRGRVLGGAATRRAAGAGDRGAVEPVLGRRRLHRPHHRRRRRARLDAPGHAQGAGVPRDRRGVARAAIGPLPGLGAVRGAGLARQ